MKLVRNTKAMANLIPAVMAVVITFAVLFIGAYVNGEIDQSLEDSIGTSPTGIQEDALATMNNTSANFDSALDLVQVVIIITLLAGAVGAIFLFTRFRG
jgi:hypothetical protein